MTEADIASQTGAANQDMQPRADWVLWSSIAASLLLVLWYFGFVERFGELCHSSCFAARRPPVRHFEISSVYGASGTNRRGCRQNFLDSFHFFLLL